MADNSVLLEALEQAMREGDYGKLAEIANAHATADFVQEYPQSGERISLAATIKMGEMYASATGTSPVFTYRRMLSAGELFVIEGTIDYGDGVPVSYCGVGEIRDGKLARMTEYFANPFEAPEWRAGFAEKIA